MLLRDQITKAFDFIENEEKFTRSIKERNNVVTEISYKKDNTVLNVIVEEMENYFYFQILILRQHQKYLISDKLSMWQETNCYAGISDVYYKNIFDFSEGYIGEVEFRTKIRQLYKKVGWIIINKKAMEEIIDLYKNLLSKSLNNIICWSQKLDS